MLETRPFRAHASQGDTAMKTTLFTARTEVVRAMTLPLCAAALALCAVSAVRAAPRSEMVTPGFKRCAQLQDVARTTPVKAPTPASAIVAFPERGHLPPSIRVDAAAPQCPSKALS
jgi:hypothetical protein